MARGLRNPPDFGFCRDSLTPTNGNGHKLLPNGQRESDLQAERKIHLRVATFCLAVAAVLILADTLGRVGRPPNSASDWNPARDVILAVHPPCLNSRTPQGVLVRFRLSNIGRQPIFCPVRPGTGLLVGEIVVRNGGSFNWTDPSGPSGQAPFGEMESSLRWIEMPPGGWVEGELYDHFDVVEDHAYEVFLKPERNSSAVRVVSKPYHYEAE